MQIYYKQSSSSLSLSSPWSLQQWSMIMAIKIYQNALRQIMIIMYKAGVCAQHQAANHLTFGLLTKQIKNWKFLVFGAVHLQQITPPLAFLQNNSVSFTSGNLWDCYTCRGGIYLHKYCLHFFFRHEINFCINKPFASIISMISCSKEKCSWQERVFLTTASLTGSWRSRTIFKNMTIFGWNLCQQITNYKLQITNYNLWN